MDELRLPTPPPIVHAPKYRLDAVQERVHLATVEYPGPVNSLDNALESLGGLASVASSFNASTATPLELNLDRGNRFSHPVSAHIAHTNNIVCRVVKRRRKKPVRDAQGDIVDAGMYQIQPIAVEHRLARFRAMADYQYTPSRHAGGDPTLDMAQAIENLDIDGIRKFEMPPPNEEFPESAFFPPPTFSRHSLPAIFDMHPAPGTIRVTTDAGVTRLINGGRYKVRTVQSILHVQRQVPTGPEPVLLTELGRDELSPLEQKMHNLLQERPCWTRTALLNQLSADDHKVINANKSCWPMISYTFADGPFRDLVIRYGYDPRTDPEARFYQHIALRNLANVRTRAQPGTRSQAQAGAASSRRADKAPTTSNLSHEFDGEHVYGKIGHFQLCDISDPLLKSLIDSPDGVLSACSSDPNEGWYAYDYLEQIRQILRRKWQGLLNGVKVSTAECEDLLAWQLSKQSRAGQPKRSRASMAGTGLGANGGKGGKGSGRRRGRSGTGANSSDDDDDSADSRSRDASSSSSDSDTRRGGRGHTGAGSDVWRSDQTSDDDDSLDSADEAAYAARRRAQASASASGTRTLRSNAGARRAASGDDDDGGGDVDDNDDGGGGGGGEEEQDGSPGPSSPSSMATGTPVPRAGPSGAGPRKKGSGVVVVAPWDRPKKKRPSAKKPETEAELFARVNLAAARRSSQQRATSSSAAPVPPPPPPAPRVDPETGEDMEEDSA
ncbi:hypothetical protein B0A53_03014 [Rhodotorula sp. CCFEE 5036]|nr:hypothetical protein B0A53_03014 [Rhodotorula sp. CCFEE 5036]